MSEPFLGEIKIISWNYAPKGWAFCNGQFLPINQNQPLFALPDLRGRVPLHVGAGITQGTRGGEAAHTVTIPEMPTHTHVVIANTADGSATPPANPRLAASVGQPLYGPPANLVAMAPNEISNAGGGQPHLNTQPYLTINFVIALQGIFPSRN